MLIVEGILNKEIKIAHVSLDCMGCELLFVKLADLVNSYFIKGLAVSYTVDSNDVCVKFSEYEICSLFDE